MNKHTLKPGWKLMKFGDVVRNANLVERNPIGNGIERIVGLEHLDPENLHIRRWNSSEDATSFSRKFVPGQTLFGKRRAYQRKVAYAQPCLPNNKDEETNLNLFNETNTVEQMVLDWPKKRSLLPMSRARQKLL